MLRLQITDSAVITLDDELAKLISPEVVKSLRDYRTIDPLLNGPVDFINDRKDAEQKVEVRTAALVHAAGLIFAELRKAQDITQAECQQISGVHQPYFSGFEQGWQDNMTLYNFLACFLTIGVRTDVKIEPRTVADNRPLLNKKKVGRYLYCQQTNNGKYLYWYVQYTDKKRTKRVYLGKNEPSFNPVADLRRANRKHKRRQKSRRREELDDENRQ